jgi:prolyl oligopeptidase
MPEPERYPPPPRVELVEDHHGEAVADPYRTLEDPDAPETIEWVAAQNRITEDFFASVATRDVIRNRLAELWDHLRVGVPFERGGRWFQLRNPGLANQPLLYVMDAPSGEGELLLDPNLLAGDGTIAVTSFEVTDDGSKLAYATSEGGSDWRTWHVRDVSTKLDTDDVVEWSKYGSVAWMKDGSGFFYSALPAPTPGAELQQENRLPRIMYHRLGTPQSADHLVFDAPEEKEWLVTPTISDDSSYLIIDIGHGTRPESQLRVLDLENEGAPMVPLVGDFESKNLLAANVGETFYLVTDYKAERQRLVAVELSSPGRGHWREVVPELEETLLGARHCGGKLVLHYLRDAHAVLRVHELDGSYAGEIPLPGLATLSEGPLEHAPLEGRPETDVIHFKATTFVDPGSVWAFDLATGTTTLVGGSGSPVLPERFIAEQVFVQSEDGTEVPLFVVRRRDVEPTGDVPVLLFGYGGFDIPMTPSFTNAQIVWMERGGVFAVAVLRGGGEYGRSWHDAGRLARKQNVFDDFAACARWLTDSGWSRPERIAIHGGSNGGLLVGASINQHPELFGAAVAEVGVLDMLRYPLFTIGWAWTSDFGDPADPEQYRWLRSYSPLHNVVERRSYPATMLMTGDHDDRVVPGHTLKFAATLQQAQGGDAPILLRVETAAGHGLGKPTDKQIAERTDFLCFLEAALGVTG